MITMKFSKRQHSLLILILLALYQTTWAEEVRYVSDELTIPMRSGTTIKHKILKFLTSGTPVIVKEVSEDGKYAWVMLKDDDNKLGWVKTEQLMKQPSARDRIVTVKKALDKKEDEISKLNQTIADLKDNNKQLETQLQTVGKQYQETKDTLDNLRKSAAKPIEIAEENKQLKDEIAHQQAVNQKVMQENEFLSDKNIKEWFMIGGGVSLGSLILGLLITRVNWRRKDSWGGGFR